MKVSSIAFGFASVLLTMSSIGAQAAETGSLSLTRAEVHQELLRARAAGELPSPSDVYGPMLTQAMAQASADARTSGRMRATAEAPAPSRTASAAK